jgi:hypothetical protein
MTVPHFGKREPGLLTAASPGDTLYFSFASYNDSGDSEALVGLNVADIEVFKNGNATARATDSGYSLISDTGQVGDRAGLYRFSIQLFNTADDASFYADGGWYQVAVDSVVVDGKTVRLWAGSFEIGRQKVNAAELGGDTGALNWLKQTYAAGFSDTGVNDRLGKILADTDTGIQSGVHVTSFSDTGVNNRLAVIAADTDTGIQSSVNVTQLRGDTGAANQLQQAFATTPTYFQQVDVQQIDGDTGAANQLELAFANGFNDTGINDRLARILADTDTGIQSSVNVTSFGDTGVNNRLAVIAADTDTGIQSSVHVTSFSDTGVNNRLAVIAADTDTGIQSSVNVTSLSDTGINQRLAAVQAKTDSLTFTVAGSVDANVQQVNDVTVAGTGANGNEWRPA